jgi:hypothetical protein
MGFNHIKNIIGTKFLCSKLPTTGKGTHSHDTNNLHYLMELQNSSLIRLSYKIPDTPRDSRSHHVDITLGNDFKQTYENIYLYIRWMS